MLRHQVHVENLMLVKRSSGDSRSQDHCRRLLTRSGTGGLVTGERGESA